jgi:hypothetical protein
VNGSRTIRIAKRDGTEEDFDHGKLAGCLWRVMEGTAADPWHAFQLAEAVGLYLRRKGTLRLTSAAVFEMVLSVLRRVGLDESADLLEAFQTARAELRRGMRLAHEEGQVTLWEKGWLAAMAERSWNLSRNTARIIAGSVELELMSGNEQHVSRRQVLDRLNAHVAEFGLADAVPVAQ